MGKNSFLQKGKVDYRLTKCFAKISIIEQLRPLHNTVWNADLIISWRKEHYEESFEIGENGGYKMDRCSKEWDGDGKYRRKRILLKYIKEM